ncbi:MAG: TolC family protein [Vicinamibacterales bacterium]
MRTALVCAALVAVGWPLGAGAQSVNLIEADALGRLSSENPRLRALLAAVDLARADVLTARRWPNPRVNWDRQSVAGVTEHYTTVSQVLPVTGRRRFDIASAASAVDAASSRADDNVRRARADLRLAFAQLVSAQDRERELQRALERLRELTAILASRERAGEAAGFDRLRAEREVLDAETDLALATTERARAQTLLASFLGEQVDAAGIVAAAPAVAPATVPPLEELLAHAETARGELAALRHERESARLAGLAAARSVLPEPELFVGTKSSTAASGGVGSALTIGDGALGPVIGLHATIPLFDRARPERALAAARVAQADSDAALFRVTLRGQVGALRETVIQRRAVAARYRLDALGSAVQIERIAQVSYDAGERGILELLDAYRLAAAARVRQTTLDLAVREAEIELEFATGWELPL